MGAPGNEGAGASGKREQKNKRDQRGLYDISNTAHTAAKQKKHVSSSKKGADVFATGVWQTTVQLKYLWAPLGEYLLEVGSEHHELINILAQNKEWTIYFIKDFNDQWRPITKYEARFKPRCLLDAVGQRLFISTPSLHSCIVIEGKGFLWLNRLPNEPFIRCNWLSDITASIRILPPINVCLDLDETLIFNSPVKGCPVPLEFVVSDPPHLLVEDADSNTGGVIPSSDMPFKRPTMDEFLKLMCPYFRNVRVATFSVEARAKEVVEHLDKDTTTLCKNYKPDPLTGQKPVPTCIFAREALLAAAEKLIDELPGGNPWLKSLEMLDLPQKGLLQRSIIIDDRVDVWIPNNHDNIVKISGPDKPANIGNLRFMNGVDGGEMGARVLLALVNLELKSTDSPAYRACCNQDKLASPKRLVPVSNKPSVAPTSPIPSNQQQEEARGNLNKAAAVAQQQQQQQQAAERAHMQHAPNAPAQGGAAFSKAPKHNNRLPHHTGGYQGWDHPHKHNRIARGHEGGEISSNQGNFRRSPSPTSPDPWADPHRPPTAQPSQGLKQAPHLPPNMNELGIPFLPAAAHPLHQAHNYMHPPHQPFPFSNKRK